MKMFLPIALLVSTVAQAAPVSLFDGKTLDGWHSKHPERWRVENGAIVSGDLKQKIPSNFFLFTDKSYADFEFRCQFRLTGDPETGLINSGIQFRSAERPDGHATGYQADIGDVEWWGCIYDEHRRNKVIAKSDIKLVGPAVRRNDWNEYVIRCEGARSRLWINGVLTVDYIEADPKIPREGKIAVQVHSGGAAMVEFKGLTIEEFERKESPLSPAEQLKTFSVPEGYEVELVASEETGLPKPITVSFDDSGRMWAITATEYPVDANETPQQAMQLWENGGQDRVVVFDKPLGQGPHTPRTFADGLAMPMGLLPWHDGAIVGQGPEILFLGDSDGDGKADSRKVLVKGFGVQDSHLMPHQFTMLPGGWIGMAQGAFNRSEVVAGDRPPVSFDYCKMGRFRPDGSDFETISYGLNNIWGFVLNREGEMFIQEANDMNYSVVPLQFGSNYPGIGGQKFKPYAPIAPPVAEFKLGGTGLSGLALSEDVSGSFPAPWNDVMLVANPITRTINSVKVNDSENGGYQLERLEDFLTCQDEWFRPIAISFGPDGCLYIVDWYNKIISHNEVPRKHPDRDKTRGRVWRVRHVSQTNRSAPDIAELTDNQLVEQLQSDSTWAMRAAWRQIVFRQANGLLPQLIALAKNEKADADARIHALWAWHDLQREDLDDSDIALPRDLSDSKNRNLRREAAAIWAGMIDPDDPDPQVRAQAIRTLARDPSESIPNLIAFAKPAIESSATGVVPWGGRHGQPIPAGPAYDRAFERYLVRAALEQAPDELAKFLDDHAERGRLAGRGRLPAENLLFASLALPPDLSTPRFVKAWAGIDRAPNDEELLLLLKGNADPHLAPIVARLFANPEQAPDLMRAALRLSDRLSAEQVQGLLTPALKKLAAAGGSEDLVIEIASAFRLGELRAELAGIAKSNAPVARRAAAIGALGRVGAGADAVVLDLLASTSTPQGLRLAALAVAGSSGDHGAAPAVLAALAELPEVARDALIDKLAGSANGVDVLLSGIASKEIDSAAITPDVLERMRTLRPEDQRMKALWSTMAAKMPRALQLSGEPGQFVKSDINLEGAFTVETWLRLDPKIDNGDGILGRPGGADFNFYDGIFRVYGGAAHGDIAVASRKLMPDAWTHVAVTRSAEGDWKIYLNGEADAATTKRNQSTFTGLNVGQTTPLTQGTSARMLEFRVWNNERSATQIRSHFDRRLAGNKQLPSGLKYYYPLGGDPSKLSGGAAIAPVVDAPELLDEAEATREAARLERFRAIAKKPGDAARGKVLFDAICLSCHTAGGKGAGAGPPLDGSGHRDLDSLLRAVLTPNAAVEPGYRVYRVETKDGRLAEGFMVKHDDNGATLRVMGGSELYFPQAEIHRARYLNRSFMIPGLFDNLEEQQVSDVLQYISTLKEDTVAPKNIPNREEAATFGKQVSATGIQHSFLMTGQKTVIVGENGQILWQIAEKSRDGSVLPNGNVLVAHAKYAREYEPSGKVVWEYQLSEDNGELERATRLENSVTMVVELGKNPQIIEVDKVGKVLLRVPLQPETDNTHMQTRMANKLPNGNYLVPHLLAFAVKEYDPQGKVVHTIKTDLEELGGRAKENWPFTAIPLANGNVLVNLTHGNKTVEFDKDGKIAWRADNTTNPGLFADPCGGQRLPNGNTIICSYGQRDPKKPRIFELTPDREVVWEFYHPQFGAHEVHVLTTNGEALAHEALR